MNTKYRTKANKSIEVQVKEEEKEILPPPHNQADTFI